MVLKKNQQTHTQAENLTWQQKHKPGKASSSSMKAVMTAAASKQLLSSERQQLKAAGNRTSSSKREVLKFSSRLSLERQTCLPYKMVVHVHIIYDYSSLPSYSYEACYFWS